MKNRTPALAADVRGSRELLEYLCGLESLKQAGWFPVSRPRRSGRILELTLENRASEEEWDCLIEKFGEIIEGARAALADSGGPGPSVPFPDTTHDCGSDEEATFRFRTSGALDTDAPIIRREIVHVTPGIRLVPPDCAELGAGSGEGEDAFIDVIIDPGWAFGSGAHPSTAACIMALEWLRNRGLLNEKTRVLDMGTGTGVLGLVAARMGAAVVAAVDVDEEAIHMARLNARANGVTDRFRVFSSEEFHAREERYDLCLANLTLSVLVRLMPSVATVLERNGRLVLSGFKEGALNTALEIVKPHGANVEKKVVYRGWMCVVVALSGLAGV